jgi:hypothetical protein
MAAAEPDVRARIRAELGSRGGSPADWITPYRALWSRVR